MKGNISYKVLVWAMTAVIGLTIIFPVYWILLSSITPKDMLFTSPINYIPLKPTLENYAALFKDINVLGMIVNTGIIIICSVIFSIVFSLLAAYAFARFSFPGSKIAFAFLLISVMLPMMSTVIPMFQFFQWLRLIDTYIGIIILYTSSMIPFTILTFVSFINQIPKSLEEAAEMDGAGTLRRIFSILLPVLKPPIATMAIINFIIGMNEFIIPLIFTSEKVKTLSVGITLIPRINQYNVPWEKISSLAIIMLVPIVIFIIIFEKNIMEGLMAGSIKQ
jgi:multiple sugar transport system permease protein